MSANFGYGEVNEFRPIYDGIDWREAFESLCERRGEPVPPPFWFQTSDDMGILELQLTQECCAVYLNRTNPNLDAIAIRDPRDDNSYWFSRTQMGSAVFEQALAGISSEVMMVQTKYPLQSVAEVLGRFALSDMSRLETDGLPEDFGVDNGSPAAE